MSYWGNRYMPMCDAIVEDAAARYVKEYDDDLYRGLYANGEFRKWEQCDGTLHPAAEALAYVLCVLDEAREDFAENGCGEAAYLYDCGYMDEMLKALRFGIVTLQEGDWVCNPKWNEDAINRARKLLDTKGAR